MGAGISQAAVNIYLCKTRVVSLFKHGPLRNHTTAYGTFAALFIALFFIYVEAVQTVFQTRALSGYLFLPPLLFAVIMLPYTEWSKAQVRRDPTGWWARHMQW